MDFIHAHPFAMLIAWWLFSAAVGSLPAPTTKTPAFYKWAYQFLNTVAANIARAYGTKVENSPNFTPAVEIRNALNKDSAQNNAPTQ